LGKTAEYLEKAVVPVLGICAGHQFMAKHFGAEVGPAEVPEYGKAELLVDEEDELFRGLPKKFNAWLSHNDEVKTLPHEFIKLAHSKDCNIQAFRHCGKRTVRAASWFSGFRPTISVGRNRTPKAKSKPFARPTTQSIFH